MSSEHERSHAIDESRFFSLGEQRVVVEDFPAAGWILDIGGGGEGVISQLKGNQVVAIDLSQRELAGINADSLKVIMDARELKFLDASFDTVTAFFSLLFVNPPDHARIFEEAFRVLKPGGRFLIWEANLPARSDPIKDIIVIRLKVMIPHKEISTGFGYFWPDHVQDDRYYVDLARKAGFRISEPKGRGLTFSLELTKP
jgi:SAM-dependent methyltransferase